MKNQVMLWTLVLAAFLASATAQEKPAEPTKATGMMSMMNCPMAVQGAEIVATDTADGIALTITTQTGEVNDLRDRVQRMLAMHGAPAKFEATENGATVTLTPKDPAELTAFRKQIREHVTRMTKGGGCEQMHQMMQRMSGMMSRPELKKEEPEADHSAHHPPK